MTLQPTHGRDKMTKAYKGTVGLLIEVETGVDLSDATEVKLKVKKPSGTTVEWAGVVSGTKIQYTTQAGDLDESGLYLIQAYVVKPTGTYLGETARMHVFDEFE